MPDNRTFAAGRIFASTISLFAVLCTSCGLGSQAPLGQSEPAAVYVFAGASTSDVQDIWDPLTGCFEEQPCDPAGTLAGIALILRARHFEDGWGLKVVFDPESTDEIRETLLGKLSRRANDLGVIPEVLISADEWPSCAGQNDCLTVAETLTSS